MRNVISRIISAALAISLPLAISSCKQEEEAKEASIALKVTGTTTESVTFEITTENAATYSYAFAKSSETGSAEYVTEDAQNGAAVKIEKSGLEAETEYTIKAYATNSDGKDCAEANATALTTARATVSIESVSVTPESITFKVAAMNAASVRYAVAGPGEDAETVELSKETEGVPEQEFTEESLEPGTNYTVVASATNEAGEESERAYLTARTDIEPVIEVTEIVPESDQAKVTVSVGEAVQFAWACTEKGAEIPDRDSFNRVTISENVNSFIVSDLEENTDYVLSIFGITRYNYEGIIHSEDFTTQEHIEKPFEITVSGVYSTDAVFSITFDKSVYSEYYYVVGSQARIPNTDDWDWVQKIENPKPIDRLKPQMLTENHDGRITEFGSYQLELESIYYVGGIPRKISGELDTNAIVWRQIQLKPVEYGQSGIELYINNVVPRLDAVSFNLDINDDSNLDCMYLLITRGTATDENEAQEYATSAIVSKPDYDFEFGKDTVANYLSASSGYVIVAIARDTDGNLSKVAWNTFTTLSVTDQGNASCSVELTDIGSNTAVFNLEFDQGTSEVLYYYEEKDEWYDPESFLKSLKVNNRNSIPASGEFEIDGLSSETGYVFGFCALDENGIQGKHYLIEESTEAHVYDGNPEAKVDITIDGVSADDFGRFYAKISAVPNSHVSKYYIEISNENNASYLTKSSFADDCLNGQQEEYTAAVSLTGRDGNGESCGSNATVWVLAIDQDGRLCPIMETRIDETWE